MTLSNHTDTQPVAKQTRKRGRSATEKRRQSTERVQRHRSNAAGTAQADIVRENDRLRMQRSRASQENTPPPSQQESALSGEAMAAVPRPQRRPMTAVPTAASVQQQPPPFAALRTPVSRPLDALLPATMTDSRAMPPTAPRRTIARVVPPSTANDTASVARGPSEANPEGVTKVQLWVFRPRRIGSGACKGAALGIPPPADRVGGTQSCSSGYSAPGG
jgi:hypothetical protein